MNGLVLAGGKSSRMNQDKAFLHYHDIPQYKYVYNLLTPYCEQIFISHPKKLEFPTIKDSLKYKEIGPLAGLLSAFDFMETDWFVIAIDYPLIELKDIELIFNSKEKSKNASIVFNTETNFFEPYLGIYKKSFFSVLRENFENKEFSVQKILKKNDIYKIEISNFLNLKNINTLEEFNDFKK